MVKLMMVFFLLGGLVVGSSRNRLVFPGHNSHLRVGFLVRYAC